MKTKRNKDGEKGRKQYPLQAWQKYPMEAPIKYFILPSIFPRHMEFREQKVASKWREFVKDVVREKFLSACCWKKLPDATTPP